MRRVPGFALVLLWCWLVLPAGAVAQELATLVGRTVASVEVQQEGRPLLDALFRSLITTEAGRPLSMEDVRDTLDHLSSVGRFDDVQVTATPEGDGVRITWMLTPAHPVRQLVFLGTLRVPEAELRQAVVERHGALPPAARVDDVVRTAREYYRDHGYLKAAISARVELQHAPDAATLAVTVEAGTRATVGSLRIIGADAAVERELLGRLPVRPGEPYDLGDLRRALAAYESDLRGRQYYEARVDPTTEFAPDGTAVITIAVERGPLVSVSFVGDALPQSVRDALVPIQEEASVDEDLLENGAVALREYLHARGYRDAAAEFERQEREGRLDVVFTVARGPRFLVGEVAVRGSQAIGADTLRVTTRLKPGEPFVQGGVTGATRALVERYRAEGFTRATVEASTVTAPSGSAAADRRVSVAFDVNEGPKAVVGGVAFDGRAGLPETQLRGLVGTVVGAAFSQARLAADRDAIVAEYLNQGFDRITVTPTVMLGQNGTRADVRFVLVEGPQVFVDHIIVLGNRRTKSSTIERELLLRPGEPLGYGARIESQRRLSGLGLFRSVRVTVPRYGSETRKDVIVEVEEALPTSLGYGGGVEGGRRLRLSADGAAEERFDLAPRGFVEIGRRNLWGSTRSVNLFTRVSLRSKDTILTDGTRQATVAKSQYGFNEYRVVGTFREPRFLDAKSDLAVNGILEQTVRSSFNVRRREAGVQTSRRMSPAYRITGTYAYRASELFDEVFTAAEKPLIDRVFPQVNLSMVSSAFVRDTRNDALDPDGGQLLGVEGSVAARRLGSEVGFAKAYVQAFAFRRLPGGRRVVVAMAARLGLAKGYARSVPRTDANGAPVYGPDGAPLVDVVEDLPASERFFAGGDTTVRGFSLDRLGDNDTITASGFPTGGNGLVVVNGELRAALFGGLSLVGFLDAGNVFQRVGAIDATRLRAAAGVGFRYKSPVGPIRVDWGFNLSPRVLVPAAVEADGTLRPASRERGNVLHISLGQAF